MTYYTGRPMKPSHFVHYQVIKSPTLEWKLNGETLFEKRSMVEAINFYSDHTATSRKPYYLTMVWDAYGDDYEPVYGFTKIVEWADGPSKTPAEAKKLYP